MKRPRFRLSRHQTDAEYPGREGARAPGPEQFFFRTDQLFRLLPVIFHEDLVAFLELLRDLSAPAPTSLVVEKRISGETVDAVLLAIRQIVPEILFRVDVPEDRPDKDENRDAQTGNIQDEPGRRELLPVLSPLRTVRAGFPAYGSSFYKAPISQHPAFRMALSLGGLF